MSMSGPTREKIRAHLSRLSSTEEKHFDLVLGHHPVLLELVLNLVVAYATGKPLKAGRLGVAHTGLGLGILRGK